jgi:hypothetical protein
MEKRRPRPRQMDDGDIGTPGSTTRPTLTQQPIRHGLTIAGALVRTVVGTGLFVQSLCASAAGLDADESRAIGPPAPAPTLARRAQGRVQPRAWEFAPPFGKPDLSPERAQIVDQLYVELMRQTPATAEDSSARRSFSVRSDR